MSREADGPVSRRLVSLRRLSLALALLLAAPGPLLAQDGAVTWDLPAFHSPYSEDGVAFHLSLPDRMDGFGASAAWRFPADVAELGARGGVHVVDGELALLAGGDVRGSLIRASDDFPLDVAGILGAGLGWMPQLDVTMLRLPVGVSAGRRAPVAGGRVAFYVHPRLGLDARFSPAARAPVAGGDGASRFRRGDDLSLHGDVDLGLDVETAGGLRLRAAVTVGHNEAVALGVLLR